MKPVLYFKGKEKGLVLNSTNLKTLVRKLSDDVAKVTGKDIVLYTEKVNFKGEEMDGIRIRVPEQPSPAETDEDLPF